MSLSDRCAPYMIGRKGGMHMHEAANGVMHKLGLLEAQRDFYRKIKWTCQSSQQWKRGWDGGGIYCFCRWIRSRRQSEYVYPDLHKRTMKLNKCWFVREEPKGGEQREKKGWGRIRKTVALLWCSFFCCCCCYLFNPLLFSRYSLLSEKLLSASRLTGPLSFFIWSELDKARVRKKNKCQVCEKVTGVLLFLSWNLKIKVKIKVQWMKGFSFLCIHLYKTFLLL